MATRSKSPLAKALVVCGALSLGGCETMNDLNAWIEKNQDAVRLGLLGGLGGTIIGAELGGSALAIALGGTAGLAIGWNVGDILFEDDKAVLDEAVRQAAESPTDGRIEWRNPKSGNHGDVRPVGDLRVTDYGDRCRDIESKIQVEDAVRMEMRTVCQQPDGSWRVVG